MKKGIRKTLLMIIALTIIFQMLIPIIPELNIEVFAADETSKETEEISRNYEVKEEETWDISANRDGSVIAKWTLKDRTLRISGTGKMKKKNGLEEFAWYNTQYTNLIKKVIIENGVTSIGWYAFSGCSSLESIDIPSSVTSIECYAFSGCSSLESINIPESVTSIEGCVFYECNSLESINVDKNNKNYISEVGILFNKEKTKIINYPAGKKDIKEYVIPSSVTSIEGSAFEGCNSLESIIIPESVTNVEKGAFRGCSSLISINIPSSVTSIGDYEFYECSSLTSINIPSSITSIGSWTFYGCSSLESINIPEGVTSINERAFSGCSSLESIDIPSSVTSIRYDTFLGCDLVMNVKADSEGHRYAEKNQKAYILEGNAEQISTDYEIKEEKNWDISANGDGSIVARWTLNNRTLIISGTGKMKNWSKNEKDDWHGTQYTNVIEKVIIENGVTSIGSHTFYECSSLESIDIPSSVTSIEIYAFYECSSLESIDIPSSVTSIGSYAFYRCSSLESIDIPSSVTSIGGCAFEGCSSLESINVDINNKKYVSEDGILFNKEKTEIIKYPEGKNDKREYIIPSTVISIGSYAFSGCSSLESINIPEGVTSISSSVFRGCSSLESINIPEGVTSIGYMAFRGCSSLESIQIPGEVTSIGQDAFYECSSLTSINIPSSITSIGWYAFYRCSSLESITIPEGVTSIGNGAFSGCSSLKSIEIPEGVTSISSSVFRGCSSLESINIPERVTSIGYLAFYECEKLIIYTNSNSQGHRYAEEEKQGYIIDEEGPTATFTPNGSNNPKKGYTVKVNVKDNQEVVGIKEESLKYLWTQSEKVPTKESFVESLKNGQSITKNTGDGIWYLWVYAKDNLDNEKITKSEGFTFDNTSPNVNIEYNTKLPAKSVVVTIKANEEIQELEGWILSEDKKVLTKEYRENIQETIIVKDLAGNETEENIDINNIDKVAPNVKVEYSTEELTRENVVVRITSNEEMQEIEGWEISEDKKVLTREYSENIEETVIVKDIAGNEKEVEIEISNIDKNGLIEKIEYSTKNPTKGSVKVTITSNKEVQGITGWALTNKKILTKQYNINTKETITVKDLEGNEVKVNIEITNIDKMEPVCYVEYGTRTLTKENVKVKIMSNEELQEIEGWALSEDKKELTKEYNGNTSETITIRDLAGNETGVTIKITNIDKVAPVLNITYSTKNSTKENVKVTITSNEQIQSIEGWELSSDKKTLTKEYSANTKETIVVNDLVGNETEVTIEITNIDKVAPVLNVTYSTKNPTKENVKVTITSNEEIQSVTGWALSSDKKALTKEYSANTKETIVVNDLVGNEAEATIEITNIDKVAPVLNVTYSTKNPTKKNVKVTITSNEEIQSVTGWALSSDKKALTKEYSANTKETIVVNDLVGNEAEATIEITNIDKVAPVLNVTYSTKNPTKKNVKVTITSNEEIQSVTGWALSSDKKALTKEYSANVKETVIVKDLVGNETEATIEITNIDKVAPALNVTYSTKNLTKENVKVTITSNEQIQSVTGWTLSSDKKTLTKEYSANTRETIVVNDLVGNEAEATIEITNIDKVAPVLNVTYSTKNSTKENVKVTITSNEEIQSVTGWALSSDKKTLTKEYTANVKETTIVKDLARNETRVTIEIDNIEGKPEITIGDINEDRKIDITDFLMLKRHLIAGNRRDWILTGNRLLAADMNENGKVDISDVLILKRNIINNL